MIARLHVCSMDECHSCMALSVLLCCRTDEMSEQTRQGFPVRGDPGNATAKTSSAEAAAAASALHSITDQDTHMPQPHSGYTSLPYSSRDHTVTLSTVGRYKWLTECLRNNLLLLAHTVYCCTKNNEWFWIRKQR